MTDHPHRRRLVAGLAALAAGAAALGWLAMSHDAEEVSCLTLAGTGEVCRFIGGPLEVEGAPVFVADRPQALFPTRAELGFVDARGTLWTAPPQTLTDGASIPAIFAALMGDRQSREYLLAAALHDAYCGIGNERRDSYHSRPWPEVHRMFYEALLVNGTAPRTARVMYAAVYLGGPRWDDPERSLADVPGAALMQELEWCLRWIEAVDPTPAQIAAWMERRETALQTGHQSAPDWDSLFGDRA
ncbi:MAG: DUF1353 domain-containing protein [Rhodobacteraceae bacterium]|nr:MAG: DUF1353 domain-containing protein [Paracoccaceae bacterium]